MPSTAKSASKVDERSAAALEQAIRDGDTSITVEQLAAARARADHEALVAEGDAAARERAAAAEHEAAIASWRRKIPAQLDKLLEDGRTAYEGFVDAYQVLAEAIGAFNAARADAESSARPLGLSGEVPGEPVDAERILAAAVAEAQGRPPLDPRASSVQLSLGADGRYSVGRHKKLHRHPLHSDAHVDRVNQRFRDEANFAAAKRNAELERRETAD